VATRLFYTWQAEEDLAALFAWRAKSSRKRAREVVRSIEERCESLLDFPMQGRARDDIRKGLRTMPVAHGIVAYRLIGDDVEVVRIFSGGRDYERILRGEDG
jgi:toxin ParE1/3/4